MRVADLEQPTSQGQGRALTPIFRVRGYFIFGSILLILAARVCDRTVQPVRADTRAGRRPRLHAGVRARTWLHARHRGAQRNRSQGLG